MKPGLPRFSCSSASVYYTERKSKNKKRGRPGNEARSFAQTLPRGSVLGFIEGSGNQTNMIVAIIMNCCWGCLPKIHPWNWHMHISMAYGKSKLKPVYWLSHRLCACLHTAQSSICHQYACAKISNGSNLRAIATYRANHLFPNHL